MSALNAVGWSDWSRPLRGSTQAASSLPRAPEPPTQLDSEQCDTAVLQLPPLRGGCDGDEQLELQMQPPGNPDPNPNPNPDQGSTHGEPTAPLLSGHPPQVRVRVRVRVR